MFVGLDHYPLEDHCQSIIRFRYGYAWLCFAVHLAGLYCFNFYVKPMKPMRMVSPSFKETGLLVFILTFELKWKCTYLFWDDSILFYYQIGKIPFRIYEYFHFDIDMVRYYLQRINEATDHNLQETKSMLSF